MMIFYHNLLIKTVEKYLAELHYIIYSSLRKFHKLLFAIRREYLEEWVFSAPKKKKEKGKWETLKYL